MYKKYMDPCKKEGSLVSICFPLFIDADNETF